jgi:AhpD family alkylhydroperoxidase
MYDMKVLGKLKTLEASAPEAKPSGLRQSYNGRARSRSAWELMALAVAFTTQCPYCTRSTLGGARAGAESGDAEVVTITAACGQSRTDARFLATDEWTPVDLSGARKTSGAGLLPSFLGKSEQF